MEFASADIHDAASMRAANPDRLSLALIDSRNRCLSRLSALESTRLSGLEGEFDPPNWWAGHCAWFQQRWTLCASSGSSRSGRTQARSGHNFDPDADARWDPTRSTRLERWQAPAFDRRALGAYLEVTLEATQELLESAGSDDQSLYPFRLALLHEDRIGETLAEIAQAQQPLADKPDGGEIEWPGQPARVARHALLIPARRVGIGSARGGLVPDNEKWAYEVALPEFEIDAQAVNWSQFAEFAVDGGYDDPRWWSEAGWKWACAQSRRAPRYVEQIAGAVVLRRRGRLMRALPGQAAVHVCAHEAEAWCRWAGRRLPAESEWEAAATLAGHRGFVWGDVFEWTASRAGRYPGHEDGPARLDAIGDADPRRVLRGASHMTTGRLRHPGARRFAAPEADGLFCGFRSCAI